VKSGLLYSARFVERGVILAFQSTIIAIGLLIGWFKKGSIWSIVNVKFKWIVLLPISYGLQYLSIYYMSKGPYEAAIVISYTMLLVFCVINIKIPGVMWTILGTALNFLALLTNSLRMPAYLPSLKRVDPSIVPVLLKGHLGKSVVMTNATHLKFLGDIFPLDVGAKALVSVGDLLFAIGVVIFIQYAMRLPRLPKEVQSDVGTDEAAVES